MKRRKIGKAQKRRRRNRQAHWQRKYGYPSGKEPVKHPMDQEAVDAMAYMSAALLFRRGRPKTEEQSEQDKNSVG